MIEISHNTKKIVKRIEGVSDCLIQMPDEFKNSTEIERSILIGWLKKKQTVDEEERFLLESLYATLLEDLNKSLSTKIKEKKKSKGWGAKAKFITLAIAGTIFFGCEGFDGITAILGIFSLPTVLIFVAGLIFSILSIVVFFAFDLMEISKNLGIDLRNAPKMVDTYLQEIDSIKSMRKKINNSFSQNNNIDDLKKDIELLEVLLEKHKNLDYARDALSKAMNRTSIKTAKNITAAITGVIFFSGGFFSGQTVALAIAALFGSAIGASAWPVILASVFVGLAALSVYWFVQRPGIENLIGRWVGLDSEKIEELTDSENIKKDQEKLIELKEKLEIRCTDLTRLEETRSRVIQLETQLQVRQVAPLPRFTPVQASLSCTPALTRASSLNSFFKQEASNEAVSEVERLNPVILLNPQN